MRHSLYILYFLLIGLAISCENVKPRQPLNTFIDTAKSFKILGRWVTPTDLVDYDTSRVNNDTLRLVTCNKYVYSPFGNVESELDFKNSLLKNFVVKKRLETYSGEAFSLYYLHFDSSNILFYFNSDTPVTTSSIYKGVIFDSNVVFENGIKTGMTATSFYRSFFKYFPQNLENKFNVVVLESCVTGIEHIYTFRHKQLNSVKFVTDYTFDIDY